jgi:hypothetical protein
MHIPARILLAWVVVLALAAPLAPASATGVTSLDWSRHPKPPDGARIVLVEPDIELSEVLASGATEPRAEWTATARSLYPAAVHRALERAGARMQPDYVPPAELPPDGRLRQVLALHEAVGLSILYHHHVPYWRLPTKREFDWTLGTGVEALREATGADYALFTYVRDSYTSGGRAAMMVFGALLGVGLGGGVQVGFTSLVDLRSGQVVWFNFLVDQTGDLRDEAGVAETVEDLLAEIPL